MGRRSFKRSAKLSLSKEVKKSKNIYVLNHSVDDMFNMIDAGGPESETILRNLVISGVIMMAMAQISISARPLGNVDYIDKLDSYRDIKKKFVTSHIGRTLAAATGIACAYPYLMTDKNYSGEDGASKLRQHVIDMVDNPSPNIKRIKPSEAEWARFARGEAGAALGQIVSCPSTNLKTVNIDSEITNCGLDEAIEGVGINKNTLTRYNITNESISRDIKKKFLVDNNGMPLDLLIYDEPSSIYSKIQNEILGDRITRSGRVNSVLVKGLEPESPITLEIVENCLNKREFMAYKFAINSGDKNILRKYTEMVKDKMRERGEMKKPVSEESPAIDLAETSIEFEYEPKAKKASTRRARQ